MINLHGKFALAALAAAVLAGCGGGGSSGGGGGGGGGGNSGPTTDGVWNVTSDATDLSGRGKWGSVVLSGYGVTNKGNDNKQRQTEAVPDGVTRYFGGTDDADGSGTMSYVIIAESGEAFRPDEEVQGLTIEASGSGTTLNHIQITNSDDDGVEWFGGAASIDHLLIQGQTDDGLDIDQGYQGTIKNALVIMGSTAGDRGIESDSDNDTAETRKTAPILANVTILGNTGHGDSGSYAALHREDFAGQVYRSVYADASHVSGMSGAFDSGCLDVDNNLNADLAYGDVIFKCVNGELVSDTDTGATATNFQTDFKNGGAGDYGVSTAPTAFSIDATSLAVTTDATNAAYDGPFSTPVVGASVTPDGYFGALDPAAATAWWSAWAVRQAGIDGNLPGGDFHPLQAEIEGGTIAPATTACSVGVAAKPVSVFGVEFPACVLSGTLPDAQTLDNGHVWLLDGSVQLGSGDLETACDTTAGTVTCVAPVSHSLTVDAGTQVFGITGTKPALVITRGSTISAVGTEAMPIIFAAVDAIK